MFWSVSYWTQLTKQQQQQQQGCWVLKKGERSIIGIYKPCMGGETCPYTTCSNS